MSFIGNTILLTFSSILVVGLGLLAMKNLYEGPDVGTDPKPTTKTGTEIPSSDNPKNNQQSIIKIEGVPFTSQAPYGNWGEIMNEEGCEEASMLMAVYWSRGDILTSEIANDEIKKISVLEREMFGAFHDTSIFDTAKVMEKYFSFKKYKVRENIEKKDIIESLKDEKILLVPVYGRDLHNIYYTPPGPVPHVIVILGYDSEKKEFITHDPGTKFGENIRFPEDTLLNAIWMYPTTSEVKIVPPKSDEIRKKGMIEVSKGILGNIIK